MRLSRAEQMHNYHAEVMANLPGSWIEFLDSFEECQLLSIGVAIGFSYLSGESPAEVAAHIKKVFRIEYLKFHHKTIIENVTE